MRGTEGGSMQKGKSRRGKDSTRDRKSGRTTFDNSGRGIWEWQTATGVFERNITDEQLSDLENSQLMLLDAATPREENRAVSYYEWQAQSSRSAKLNHEQIKTADAGPLKRLINRFVRKS
jgi:hypothetical protein